jgi:hypothetical protein
MPEETPVDVPHGPRYPSSPAQNFAWLEEKYPIIALIVFGFSPNDVLSGNWEVYFPIGYSLGEPDLRIYKGFN